MSSESEFSDSEEVVTRSKLKVSRMKKAKQKKTFKPKPSKVELPAPNLNEPENQSKGGNFNEGEIGMENTGDTMFPITPQLSTRYVNIEEFYEECIREAESRFKINLDCNVLFTRRFFPSMEKCRYVYVTCNFCNASMTFKQEIDGITAQRICRAHRHTIQMVSKLTKADIKQRTLPSQRQDPERKKNSSSETAQLLELKQTIKKLKPEKDNYKHVKATLKVEGYKTYEYYREMTESSDYPDVMVMLSPTMLQNMISFGDSLGFEVVSRKLSIDYLVGMFCVYDTNVRLLIGGMALICNDDEDTIDRMFEGLFGLINIRPRVIRTIQKQSIQHGLTRVVQKYPDITHLVDLTKVLVNFRRHLSGSQEVQAEILRLIGDLLVERDVIKSKKLQTKLLIAASDSNNEHAVEHILSNREKIIYIHMPPIYFGFNRAAQQKISDIFKALFTQKLTVPTFIRSIQLVEKYLQDKINTSQSFYKNPVENQFKDEKIKEVRENVERKIFNKFLENYLDCNTAYTLKSLGQPEDPTMVVEYKKYKYEFKIVDWKCPCHEVEKTGIPCPHLLICAKNTPGQSYLELFHQRWWRKQMMKKEPEPFDQPDDRQKQPDP